MIASEKEPNAVCSACGAEMDTESTACFHCGHARRSAPLKKGQVIADRYELTAVLGRGGMGTVYEAHDRSLDERVALKVLSETAQGSADADRRFRAEIKLARKIRHPNVCAIHEYGELADIQYIVMEFVDGQDLKKYVRSRGTLTTNEAIDLACQVGEGLQAIHEAGVIHRDLKLANVMRDGTGRLRLMDFGIAKGMGDTTATATGHIVGTPEYMSPEQARGEKVDLRSDVYALGILTHELLTGRVPFKADTPLATMMLHVNEPPRLDDPRILPGLAPVLRKALAKSPEQRYDSARAFVAALRAAIVSTTSSTFVSATPVSSPADQATIELVTARSTPLSRTLKGPAISMPASATARGVGRPGRSWGRWAGAASGALLGLFVVGWLGIRLAESLRDRAEQKAPQPVVEPWPATLATAAPGGSGQPAAVPSPSIGREVIATTPSPAAARATPSVARVPIATQPAPAPDMPSTRPTITPAPIAERVVESAPQPTVAAVGMTLASPAAPSPAVSTQQVTDAVPPPGPTPSRQNSAAPVPAAMALLIISVKPAAEITLDGKVLGEAGAYTAPVTPGEHVIRFAHKNWQPLSRTVSVGGGERLKVAVDLKDEGIPRKK